MEQSYMVFVKEISVIFGLAYKNTKHCSTLDVLQPWHIKTPSEFTAEIWEHLIQQGPQSLTQERTRKRGGQIERGQNRGEQDQKSRLLLLPSLSSFEVVRRGSV